MSAKCSINDRVVRYVVDAAVKAFLMRVSLALGIGKHTLYYFMIDDAKSIKNVDVSLIK